MVLKPELPSLGELLVSANLWKHHDVVFTVQAFGPRTSAALTLSESWRVLTPQVLVAQAPSELTRVTSVADGG